MSFVLRLRNCFSVTCVFINQNVCYSIFPQKESIQRKTFEVTRVPNSDSSQLMFLFLSRSQICLDALVQQRAVRRT